jgi:hypothetical protein
MAMTALSVCRRLSGYAGSPRISSARRRMGCTSRPVISSHSVEVMERIRTGCARTSASRSIPSAACSFSPGARRVDRQRVPVGREALGENHGDLHCHPRR